MLNEGGTGANLRVKEMVFLFLTLFALDSAGKEDVHLGEAFLAFQNLRKVPICAMNRAR